MANRQVARQVVGFALDQLAHEQFDDAVFQRVEADDDQTAADFQAFQCSLKASFQIAQLVVDVNAQPLECTGGRVLALFPRRVGDFQHFGQIAVRSNGVMSRRSATAPSHATGETLFAVFLEDAGDFFHRRGVDELRCADPRDGSMRMSSGPSFMKLKPRSGSSSCGEDTPRSSRMPLTLPARPRSDLRTQLGKAALHNDKAAVFGRQRLPGGNRLWIFVESDEPTVRPELLQDKPAVSAAPERAIQIAAIGAYRESLDGFFEQYGDVGKAAIQ
jgi:hypothetical protein